MSNTAPTTAYFVAAATPHLGDVQVTAIAVMSEEEIDSFITAYPEVELAVAAEPVHVPASILDDTELLRDSFRTAKRELNGENGTPIRYWLYPKDRDAPKYFIVVDAHTDATLYGLLRTCFHDVVDFYEEPSGPTTSFRNDKEFAAFFTPELQRLIIEVTKNDRMKQLRFRTSHAEDDEFLLTFNDLDHHKKNKNDYNKCKSLIKEVLKLEIKSDSAQRPGVASSNV